MPLSPCHMQVVETARQRCSLDCLATQESVFGGYQAKGCYLQYPVVLLLSQMRLRLLAAAAAVVDGAECESDACAVHDAVQHHHLHMSSIAVLVSMSARVGALLARRGGNMGRKEAVA